MDIERTSEAQRGFDAIMGGDTPPPTTRPVMTAYRLYHMLEELYENGDIGPDTPVWLFTENESAPCRSVEIYNDAVELWG